MTNLKVYNFMGLRKVAAIFSAVLLLASVASPVDQRAWYWVWIFPAARRLRWATNSQLMLRSIRQQLEAAGFEGPVVIQYGSETDVLIRLQGKPEQGLSEKVYAF